MKKAEIKHISNYDQYMMTIGQKVVNIAAASLVIYVFAFIFYRDFIISALFLPLSLIYPKIRVRSLIKKRKQELNIQFKDMLYSLSSSLSAGRSIETAFREALKDLALLYPDPGNYIIVELKYMIRKMEMNETVESALEEFASRAALEDVNNFVDVFQICKRTGGNLVEVIKSTSAIINDKVEIKQEIETMLAERKFEQKVLNAVPVSLILLLSISAGEYINPVFTTNAGKLVMSISLLLLMIAFFISKKITDIKV